MGRAIETTPVASLDTGKGQGNHSLDARSWGISQATYCEGQGRERKIACDQPEKPNGSDQFQRRKDVMLRVNRDRQARRSRIG